MSACISFLSKDNTSLTERSLPALIQTAFDTFWIDGSRTEEGKVFLLAGGYPVKKIYQDVQGGPDSAIVFALTEMLKVGYDYVGLCEQDVQLPLDWWGSTTALFERGKAEGLEVGAVSPRCYEDRILCQCDGYALVHNLGAGVVLFTRQAAQILLANYRTARAPDNRLIFSQLSGVDIGKWWAFRGSEQFLSADWNFDAILARHGLASLALTPSLATMLDQDIASQGLKMADGKMDLLRNGEAFDRFAHNTKQIREGNLQAGINGSIAFTQGAWTIFPHQVLGLGGKFSGDWRLKWSQGFGPFAWEAGKQYPFIPIGSLEETKLEVPILGPCEFLISGGAQGGKVELTDTQSGYKVTPELAPEGLPAERRVLTIPVPGGCNYRTLRLTCLTPGVTFYGLRTTYAQPWHPTYSFDWSKLPRAE